MEVFEEMFGPLQTQIEAFMSANGLKLAGVFVLFVLFYIVWNVLREWLFPRDDLGFRAWRGRY